MVRTGLIGLLVVGFSSCGTTYMSKGSWEAEGNLELSTESQDESDFDSDTLATEAFVGTAATDNLELGPAIAFRWRDVGVDGIDVDTRDLTVAWRFRWNFPHEEEALVSPFAEVDLGVGRRDIDTDAGDADSTELLYGLGGGMRFIFTEGASVILKAQYTHIDWDREVGGNVNRWGILGGLAIRF